MTSQYLTLKEAQQFTQKSRSTLRRFVEGIVKTDDHADRAAILPTVSEVAELKQDNQPFSWRISEELLTRDFRAPEEKPPAEEGSHTSQHHDRLVSVLEKTVVVLQEELNEKNRQISAFQERQREQHHLMRSLSDQLALKAPASPANELVVEAAEDQSTKSDTKQGSQPSKKKFWLREFHLFGRG